MLEGLPIMLALCFMLWHAYYAQNYAGIIDAGLPQSITQYTHSSGKGNHLSQLDCAHNNKLLYSYVVVWLLKEKWVLLVLFILAIKSEW